MITVIGPGMETDALTALVADQPDNRCDLLLVNALSDSAANDFDQLDDQLFDKRCIEDVVDCFSDISGILPSLRTGSRIVFLVPSVFLGGTGCAYQATSAAMLVGLARSLALELADQMITVNCLAPSKDGKLDGMRESIAFLLTDKAADVSGQVILIDGGTNLSLRKS